MTYKLGIVPFLTLPLAVMLLGACNQPPPVPSTDIGPTETVIARRAVATYRAGVAAAATTTPEPTFTAVPTWTPRATSTPRPPNTPVPTSTALPTPTALPDQAIYLKMDLKGKILFWTTDRLWKQGPRVYVMEADGSTQVPLSNDVLLDTLIYNYYADRETRTADGQWKLYVEDSGPGQTNIVIRSTAGEKVRRVVSSASVNYEPAWSPDTMWVAFVSQRDGNDEVYVIDTNGQTPMRRTNNTWEWDRHPSWAADGRRLVFWSNRDGGHKQIFSMNADGSEQKNLSSNSFDDWDPIWVK